MEPMAVLNPPLAKTRMAASTTAMMMMYSSIPCPLRLPLIRSPPVNARADVMLSILPVRVILGRDAFRAPRIAHQGGSIERHLLYRQGGGSVKRHTCIRLVHRDPVNHQVGVALQWVKLRLADGIGARLQPAGGRAAGGVLQTQRG